MKKSPTFSCAKENLHSTLEVVKASRHGDRCMKYSTCSARCKPATDRSKSAVVDRGRVHIDPSRKLLAKRGNAVPERTRSCHVKQSEQARTQAETKKELLNKTNGEQSITCFSVKKINKQDGGQRGVEGSKKRSEGTSSSHAQSCCRGLHWNASTVRRYALYRGMLKSSATTESTKSGSERWVHCVNEGRRSSGMRMKTSSEQSLDVTHSKVQRPQAVVPLILDDVGPTFDFTRGFDLKGTQFPKRIYIREHVNNAIVDELVHVRNQEDWDRLTYMAPLRPITANTTHRPHDLRFQDLRDFDVYHYPFDWRHLAGN